MDAICHVRINLRESAKNVRERLRDAESTRGSCERAARVREACEKLQKQACKNCGVGSSCKRLMALSLLHCRTIKPTYKRRKRNYYFVSLAWEISRELKNVVKTSVHATSDALLEGNPKVILFYSAMSGGDSYLSICENLANWSCDSAARYCTLRIEAARHLRESCNMHKITSRTCLWKFGRKLKNCVKILPRYWFTNCLRRYSEVF